MISLTIDNLHLVSEANDRSHWTMRRKRERTQKSIVWGHLQTAFAKNGIPGLPAVVRLTRIAPRRLDSDNLARAFKAIRDQVATCLLPATAGNQSRRWADDSDAQLSWEYDQRQGRPKQHAVCIEIIPQGQS